MNDGRIPIIIGVTGHRDIRVEDTGKLRASVSSELGAIIDRCPHSEVFVMTSLAEGADQLCAETALDMGIGIISVLPMEIDEYSRAFTTNSDAYTKLYELYSKSSNGYVAPFTEPFREGRDYLYRQAGIYVAMHSHILLSLWDGTKGEIDGCGTAAITGLSLESIFSDAEHCQLHPANRTVIQIVTPRDNMIKAGVQESSGQESDGALIPGKTIIHGDYKLNIGIIEKTDVYNADCLKYTDADATAYKNTLQAIYERSDRLSVVNAKKYRVLLAALSIAATGISLAFLLYDEMNLSWMVLVCVILIICVFAINRIAVGSGYHRKYVEYRIMAELCRVQTYLFTAGIACEVSNLMPWNLQIEVPWTGRALSAANGGMHNREGKSIFDNWVMEQRNYHVESLQKAETQLRLNDRIVKTALLFTIALYFSALVFEFLCGNLNIGGAVLPIAAQTTAAIKSVFLILMGLFSIGTLFAGNYYGKLALPDIIDEHRKMISLYAEAEQEIRRSGEKKNLLIKLAENELYENSNWYASQSKNGLDFSI